MELTQSTNKKYKNIYYDVAGNRYRKCTECNEIKAENDQNYKFRKDQNNFLAKCRFCRQKEQKEFDKKKKIKHKQKIQEKIKQYNIDVLTCYDIRKKNCFIDPDGIFFRKCTVCDKIKIENEDNFRFNRSICRICEREKKRTLEVRLKNRAYEKKRRQQNPLHRLRLNISNAILKALTRGKSDKAGQSILQFLGYTISELKLHITLLFDEHMTWENYGTYWHLDHIIPQSDLPYTSMKDDNFKQCWDLSNLRPLEARQNILDGTRRIRHKKK